MATRPDRICKQRAVKYKEWPEAFTRSPGVRLIAVGAAYQAFRMQVAVLALFLLASMVAFAVIPFSFLLSGVKGGAVVRCSNENLRPAKHLALAALAASLVAGCTVGPDFAPPDPLLPSASFFGKPEPAVPGVTPTAPEFGKVAPVETTWWATFHDPLLTSLEERVPAANLDVGTATFRLAESRAQLGMVSSAALPSINGNATYQRALLSENGVVSLLKPLVPAGTPFFIPPFSFWQTGFDASWEIDLWGHVRRRIETAGAEAQAAEEDRRGVLISTLAELARDYVQLRGTQRQIAITKKNLATNTDILELTKTRAAEGLTSQLDVKRAAAQVASVKASLPNLENQESMEINALCILLDEPPLALKNELSRVKAIPPAPPRVPLGIPSELARRRPDIREAEANLHAQTAGIGVAVAEFYPSFRLNANIEYNALDLKKIFQASSLEYVIGPSVSLPIFDGGRLKSQLELREVQQQEAAIAYHKTVLQAWREVVDALIAYRDEEQRRASLAEQVAYSRSALDLSRTRYEAGATDFLTVLDAERTVLGAELAEAQSIAAVSTDVVQLYKALGGGWEPTFPDAPPARVETVSSVQ
jgi:NodT family efflux transporter outer membrane factor (OMF) lipoprotein